MIGAIETGGTTIKAAVINIECIEQTKAEYIVPTTTNPEECLSSIADWLSEQNSKTPLKALGIAAFGPIDLNKRSKTYGFVTTTPKPGWRQTDLVGFFAKRFPEIPIGFDTDVNAAALSEYRHGGHGGGVGTVGYVTVGTGVGGGVVADGTPTHGALHPEMGHLIVPRAEGDTFEGCCPFHKCCIEGLVATPALTARFNLPDSSHLPEVEDNSPQWNYVAHYLAHLCAALVLFVSPDVIVLGGGVMERRCLLELIRKETKSILNGYIQSPCVEDENFIVTSKFKGSSGIVGAAELGRRAFLEAKQSEESKLN